MNHPQEELLSDYVDGILELPQRAAVEAHLAFCLACRGDVQAARSARAALMELQEAESPGVDLSFVPGLSPSEVAETARLAPGSRPEAPAAGPPRLRPQPTSRRSAAPTPAPARRRRPSMGQVLVGVAAAAVALVAGIILFGTGSPSGTPSSGNAAQGSLFPIASPSEAGGQDFTSASFATFAGDLAREAKRPDALRNAKNAPTIPGSVSADTSASVTDQAVACVQQGTGLASGTHLYFAEPGTLNGQRVYVVALVNSREGHDSLLVVAVTVQGCQPLQVIHEAL